MSLYEVADGILETHVTWKDVEEEMQKKFGTMATFGEKKTGRNISDQKGFMSKIAVIEADWQNVEEGMVLPEKFAVKHSDENGFEEEKLKFLGNILREAHNREVEAYKLLERFNHPDVPYTKAFALKPFLNETDLKGYFIMEYIPDIFTTSMSAPISAEDLIPTIRGVATFAALGHKLPEDQKKFALGAEFLEYYFNKFLGPASIESTLENLKTAFSFLESSRVVKLIAVYRQYLKVLNKFTRMSDILGFHLIFNHGDLWQSNMIYKSKANGMMELKAIIDWQAISLLPPGFDLARLFIGSLSVEDRRQKVPQLLQTFHKTFTSVLGHELFPLKEIIDSYKLHFPLMSLRVLPGMAAFLDAPNLEDPEKAEARKRTMKKMEGILEDVLEVHEYNLNNYSDFLRE